MDDEDYLADLIKKVKQAKKDPAEAKPAPKKAALKAKIPKEVEGIKREPISKRIGAAFGRKPAEPVEGPAASASLESLIPAQEEKEERALEKLAKPAEATSKPVKKLLEEEETHGTVPKELVDGISTAEKELEAAKKKKLLASYGDVRIFSVPGRPLPYYMVPVVRPTRQEKAVINTIKEAATRLIAITPYKIRDLEQKRAVYKQHIIDILKNSPELHIPEKRFPFYAEAVVREMVGYGIVDPLVMDDDLEEIMVVGAKKPVFLFHRKHEMMSSNIEFYSDKEIIDLINRIARNVGRRVDISNPLLDARLPDGSRVNATIPPASVNGATITIRKFRKDPYTVTDLINSGTMSSEVAAFLWICVEGMGAKPANILISGGTSSGKTTTLNCLASFIPETERVVTIEDTAELDLPLKHWIRMEARPPGLEGRGELTIDILTKNSLRMRPDRILVGEVRHDEAFTLFTAMNTGHDGSVNGDALIQLSDGNIVEIGKLVEKEFEDGLAVKEDSFEFVKICDKEVLVPSLNKETLKLENKRVTHVWRKKCKENLCKIRLRGGKELLLTKDHPVYRISNGIQEINAGEVKTGDFLALPTEIKTCAEKELMKPYLIGLIYGDGHLGVEAIQFVNKESSLIDSFKKDISPLSKNKLSQFDYEGFSRVQLHDKRLIREINETYDMPIGNKTKIFKFEEKILLAKDGEIAKLVQGLFDCEAHVNLLANCIQFSTSNKDLAKKTPLILTRFGISSSSYSQEKDGKGNIGPYFRISIYGKENLKKFEKKIGFRHLGKKEKLTKLVEKSKDNLDLFPNLERAIKRARLEADLTQYEMGALLGTTTGSTVASYERSVRKPSRKQLRKISDLLEGKTVEQLRVLADSELRFEKVVSVEEEWVEGHVYDLTVEDNHNYIANGIMVSNCLGTIHANSAQETLVRVTSPPMNVPQVMLSGLDFILIEHKIHDKRKGTIRRITEIAEISGVLLKKAQTQTLFERDAAKDTIERTNMPIKFFKVLQNFTGYSRKTIEADWQRRKEYLEEMQRKNIVKLADVKKELQKYNAGVN